MLKPKINVFVLSLTTMVAVLSSVSLLQPHQAAYSQTDYEEYIIMENVDQRINQQNIGGDSSTNINCGTNIAGSNLAQPATCPSIPGETPISNVEFTTVTVSNTVHLDVSGLGTAEVSCPEGTEVTGGGHEIRNENGRLFNSPEIGEAEDRPTDNGWKVTARIPDFNPGTLTVYAICGSLVEQTP